MEKKLRNTVLIESIWLIGLLITALILEYSLIELLNLHPVLSVKIQGFIGLLLIGYSIRMGARLWKSYRAQGAEDSN